MLEEHTSINYQPPGIHRVYTCGHSLISQDRLENASWVTSFYGYDGHSNVRYLTDLNGFVTDTYDYDAFGNLIAQTGSTPNEHLYCGEQFDAGLGLYFLRARYLNTDSGRFWTMDDFEGFPSDPISLHKYLFVSDDPVNKIDPSGNIETIAELNFVSAEQARDRGERARRAYQGYQKVRSTLCKIGYVGGEELHHALPIFLGGDPNQKLVGLDAGFHKQFHQLLHYMLRWVGLPGGYGSVAAREKYRALFNNPVTRETAHAALVGAAEIFDLECANTNPPTPKLLPRIREQIAEGKWEF